MELAYPVSEGLVGGFLCCFNNFIGTVFLALFFIPNLGTIWMNYVQVFGAVGKSKAEIGISNYYFFGGIVFVAGESGEASAGGAGLSPGAGASTWHQEL